MKKIVAASKDQQAKDVAKIIAEYVEKKPDAILCLAAGDTPTETYGEMARLQQAGLANFKECRLIGLDEWVGVNEAAPGGCKKYIIDHVIKPLQLPLANVMFFDACAQDLAAECAKADAFLMQNGPIGLSLMGVGMNGHIALNEPGCSFDATAHVMELDPMTVQVAQKYFNSPTPATQGITLGMQQIMGSELLIVIANGAKKQGILHEAMYGPVTNNVPASALQDHPNCIVSLDAPADS